MNMSAAAAAAGGFLVLLLSVSAAQDGWWVRCSSSEICSLKGSTVSIDCSYRFPSSTVRDPKVEKRFWFIKKTNHGYVDLKTDPGYSDRVTYHCNPNRCTMTITDLRLSDSAVYKFRFIMNQDTGKFTGEPGVSVSVTDQLRVDVRKASSWTELTCRSACQQPDLYVWFKDGHKVQTPGKTLYFVDSSDSSGRYHCAMKGHERSPSPPVYAPDVPSVSVLPSGDIVENSSVTLTCSSDANPAANYTWYQRASHPESIHEGPQLVFSSIQSSDSGHFYCVAENQLGRNRSEFVSINVEYAPDVPSVSVVPSGQIVEHSSVTLTCSSDANPAANYTWYKEEEEEPKASGQNFTITDVRAEDGGRYSCEAWNSRGRSNSTVHLTLAVGFRDALNSAVVGLSSVLVLVVLVVLIFLLIRKRRIFKQSGDDRADREQTGPARSEQRDDVPYASVCFMKHHSDPVYSNVPAAGAQRLADAYDSVEYAAVQFGSSAPRTVDGPAALYSTSTRVSRT